MKLVVLIALLAVFASARERRFPVFDSPCSVREGELRRHVKIDFSGAQYAGVWFEIERYQHENEPEWDCASSFYIWNNTDNTMRLIRFGRILDTWDTVGYHADAFLAEPDAESIPGIFNVHSAFDDGPADYTYLILGSDYFQYSLVWYCYDIAPNQSQEFSTVFSRTPDLPPPQRQRVDELIQLHLNSDFMRPTEQADEVCSN